MGGGREQGVGERGGQVGKSRGRCEPIGQGFLQTGYLFGVAGKRERFRHGCESDPETGSGRHDLSELATRGFEADAELELVASLERCRVESGGIDETACLLENAALKAPGRAVGDRELLSQQRWDPGLDETFPDQTTGQGGFDRVAWW